MKKLTPFLCLLISFTNIVQAQQTCSTAISITPSNTCIFTSHTTTGTEYWLKFVASSPTVNISLITAQFGINATHIHNLAILTGNCSSPILIADDELPFVNNADQLNIDLNASGLNVGQTYFIRATRFATQVGTTCNKSGCTANNSTDPTTFNICVQDIDVFIPLDFGLEFPSSSYSYQTNRGQIVDIDGNKRPDIKLYTPSTNPAIYIGEDTISYVFSKVDTLSTTIDTMYRVDMTLVGANTGRAVFKTEQLAGVTNYYLPQTPLGLTGNKDYFRTATTDIYPNIDMQWYSNSMGEKFYFIVKPSGDPDDIILQFDGATNIAVTGSGGLIITTSLGNIEYEPPHAYRINPASNVVPMPWQCKFEVVPSTTNQVKFKVHNYDPKMPLFIQVDKGHKPPLPAGSIDNLTWSTYFNGAGDDIAYDVTTDAAENVYVVGTTGSNSATFPVTTGEFQDVLKGIRDVFVFKFDFGASKIFSTYYGGTGAEEGYGIAIGSTNNLYFTGTSGSSSLPTLFTNNGVYIQSSGHSNYNGFIAEMDATNGFVEWESFFGGSAQTKGYKVAVDNANNLFLIGRVQYTTNFATATGGIAPSGGASGGFPLLSSGGAYLDNTFDWDPVYGSSSQDAFIAKFNSSNQLEWSTLFGGNGFDDTKEIAIDPISQQVVITGKTLTSLAGNNICGVPTNGGFPMCNPSSSYYQNTYISVGGFGSGYISKFTNSGILRWSTYFDGLPGGLVFNSNGELFISGITQNQVSSNSNEPPLNGGHPILNSGGAYTQNNGGNWDVYINKFNTSNALVWGTFYGGTTEEMTTTPMDELGYTDLAVDNSDNIYLTGATQFRPSSINDFPTLQFPTYYYEQYLQPIVDYIPTAFIVAFNASNQRQWATIYGALSGTGTSYDGYDNGLAITTAGNSLYVVGFTHSVDFPYACPTQVTGVPFCQNYTTSSSFDVFLSRFDISATVGLNETVASDHDLLIYPNPTENEINIKFYVQDKSDISISIYNVVGQKIYDEQIQDFFGSCKKKISTENYANGMYVISINFGEGTVVKKIVKQ